MRIQKADKQLSIHLKPHDQLWLAATYASRHVFPLKLINISSAPQNIFSMDDNGRLSLYFLQLHGGHRQAFAEHFGHEFMERYRQ